MQGIDLKIGIFRLCAMSVIFGVAAVLTPESRAADSALFLPAGIVFPEFTHALQTDAAGLPYQQGKALQLEYSPAMLGASQTGYDATFSYSQGTWALGVGYEGAQAGGGAGLSHALLAGAGARFSDVGVGLSMSSPFLTTSFSPAYDVSIQIGNGSALQFAGILYHVTGSVNTMALGIGHREASSYAFEGGLRLPFLTQLFDSGSSTNTIPYLAGMFFIGPVGASLGISSHLSALSQFSESMGLLWAPSGSQVKLTLLYNSPETITLGLALAM
ncbi:hypothetical protein WDW37_17050 [Bdellovibrionota bacterium FG-1]